MAEWLQSTILRFDELNSVEEKKAILEEIKLILFILSKKESEQDARTLDYSQLFTQLTSDDREYVSEICDILKVLFTMSEPEDVHERYVTHMLRLITHSDAVVRSLILQEILRVVSNPRLLPLLLTDTTLFLAVIDRIADPDGEVAKCAMRILKDVGKNANEPQIKHTFELLKNYTRSLEENETVSFRVYDVVVDIANVSKQKLDAAVQSGLLNGLFDILEGEDVLASMNALEVMTQLALTEDGLSYLEEQDVLRKLAQKIAQANENRLSHMLIPGLMKFFGNVARYWPNEIFSKYPVVVSSLFKVIESRDRHLLGVALDTLGHISVNAEGKYALQALGDAMPLALKKIARVILIMPTELKIRGLENLALILDVKKAEQDKRILSLTKSWFDCLHGKLKPLTLIVNTCRLPFWDLRRAGLEVLAVIAAQTWGQECISASPGLVEFLLDRNSESFSECKQAKYEVVRQLSQAESNIFDARTMQKFVEFVNQGPHYVEIITEVAMDSAL